jgi:hypothetical protein
MENFANDTPPPNPIKGQLWYNTSANTLNVCPADGETSAGNWLTLASTNSGGDVVLGELNVTGNLTVGNIVLSSVDDSIIADSITVRIATVSDSANIGNANLTVATIGSTHTRVIWSDSAESNNAITGNIHGSWTFTGNSSGNAIAVTNGAGNIAFASGSTNGIRCDNYMYANGASFNPSGTYNDGNVYDYLTGSNAVTRFSGEINPSGCNTTIITTGANNVGGTITGNWTLSAGSRLNATYADLAERFEADMPYAPGTVVELGGDKEITAVVEELSESVFGVISNTAALMMNSASGNDQTHPPVAVSGRVLVKVTGPVKKGERLVSAGNGTARAAKPGEVTAFNTIGRSLAYKEDDGLGTVEAIVIIR